MSTILIIGASQGLGLEWVRHYKKQGYTVIATCRNPESADELKDLLCGIDDKIIPLDVTDEGTIASLNEQLPEAPDIMIYNAGVKGYSKLPDTRMTLLNATFNPSRKAGRELAFQVNAHGFDEILHALKDKLLAKPKATVVYVSTGVADTRDTSGGYPHYRESKAAGDSYARNWDVDLSQSAPLEFRPRIFSLVPGIVNTGMGAGVEKAADPEKRVAEMAEVIDHVKETGDTYGVWKYDGTKFTEYQKPASFKELKSNQYSNATILANKGLYSDVGSSSNHTAASMDSEMIDYWNSKDL